MIPNRLILIVDDGYIDVDGDGIPDIDMTGIDPSIHAVQWYGTWGEVEYRDKSNPNRRIESLDEFGIVLTKHQGEVDKRAATAAAEAAYAASPEGVAAANVAQSKQYLSDTDWIVTKIYELELDGQDTTALKTKYADELSNRKLMRETINLNGG